jgi:CDP-diacylglycerol--glycerol-3-phosphate 3-phosphatidyltransferase
MGIWNLPNRITFGRLLLAAALFTVLVLMHEDVFEGRGGWAWTAFALFIVAAATDWLDGWLARRLGMVTAFGRIMDPFVDKVVVCGTFILLCQKMPTVVPPWMVVVIVGREFFVSAIRGFMESQGVAFGADMAGKVKMVIQCVAIGAILFMGTQQADSGVLGLVEALIPVAMWTTLLATLYSGWYYAKKAFTGLKEIDA